MPLILRVKLRRAGEAEERTIETSAQVNTGYLSGNAMLPEIYLPLSLARRLGFNVEKARRDFYAIMRGRVEALILGDVEVQVVVPDRDTPWVKAVAITVPGGRPYTIISAELLHFLNVAVIDTMGLGLWAFRDELGKRVREGVPLEFWPS